MIVARGITLPVDHDVMLVRDCRRQIELATALDDHLGARHWMALHHLALFVSELARLVENVLRNIDLAEVVQQTRYSECTHVLLREVQ